MKNSIVRIFFILAIAVSFLSCGTAFELGRVVMIDYSKYIREGFYLSESPCVDFSYTPVATVIVRLGTYDSNVEKAFEKFVEESKLNGADGIINLNYTILPDNKGEASDYIIKGMLIHKN